jgi:hypothetical protein
MGDYHEGVVGSPAGLCARRQHGNCNDRSPNCGGADRGGLLGRNFLNCARTLDAVSTLGPQFLAVVILCCAASHRESEVYAHVWQQAMNDDFVRAA